MTQNKIFIHCPELDEGGYPPESPFDTHRAGQVRQKVDSMGLLSGDGRSEVVPVKATREELETFHTPRYLDLVHQAQNGELTIEGLTVGLGTPDCPVFKDMYDYVSLACGGTITGARLILSGDADIAFNPSGGFHHADAERAAGFCYMNDVVLAANVLREAGKRVLFLDIDVHHSDGVQNAFYDTDQVMTISMHETGRMLFPGTGFENEIGVGAGEGYAVNLPMPVATYDDAYYKVFKEAALPFFSAFDPDVIMLELGMDALAGDPLAHLNLTNNVYVDIIEDVMKLGKPILATGGGGYNFAHTVRGWALAWRTFCGEGDDDAMLGMGGVMLENTEWSGGLRDRMLISEAGARDSVDAEVDRVIRAIQTDLFPRHRLPC